MILGVVLCGGESKRMGSDKGLLPINETTWAQATASKLTSLDIPVVISVNEKQQASYSRIFPTETLITDQNYARGPLNGILSVHEKYPDQNLLLVACDMMDMDHQTLRNLKDAFYHYPGFDFYVYGSDYLIEPLCAIYSARTLSIILNKVTSNEITSFALHKLISAFNFKTIAVPDKKAFANYNSNPIT